MDECVSVIKAFIRGGEYSHDVLLPKVIENIWKHHDITSQEDKARCMELAYHGEVIPSRR